jgi:hypothetical protein
VRALARTALAGCSFADFADRHSLRFPMYMYDLQL